MRIKQALNIVLDLAEQNVLEEREALRNDLEDERQQQLEACERVRLLADELSDLAE
jgi:gamma-glutamylcysteine synthetase